MQDLLCRNTVHRSVVQHGRALMALVRCRPNWHCAWFARVNGGSNGNSRTTKNQVAFAVVDDEAVGGSILPFYSFFAASTRLFRQAL